MIQEQEIQEEAAKLGSLLKDSSGKNPAAVVQLKEALEGLFELRRILEERED